jgi:hypothetical protein
MMVGSVSQAVDIKSNCLLRKWLFKLLINDDMLQKLLYNQYLTSKSLSEFQAKQTYFYFWKGIIRSKDDLFQRGSFVLGYRQNTLF